MKVEVRKTAQGTEYWDTEEKRTLFVPAGQEPDFEVAVNPASLVIVEPDIREDGDGTNLENMTIPQLKDFAKQIEVDIPKEIKKKEDIIKYLADAE